MVRISSSFL